MEKQHTYNLTLQWTGNTGRGTSGYKNYERSHIMHAAGRPEIQGSSDPAFRGDKTRYNPEQLLVASIAACHMLWYLHLCAEAGVVVVEYKDHSTGIMQETANGGGFFTEVTLYPEVIVQEPGMIEKANSLHKQANELCFIARSVKFPVHHKPVCRAVNEAQPD
jgi:organic hydroperoxide reductase OsmC/OhrA